MTWEEGCLSEGYSLTFISGETARLRAYEWHRHAFNPGLFALRSLCFPIRFTTCLSSKVLLVTGDQRIVVSQEWEWALLSGVSQAMD